MAQRLAVLLAVASILIVACAAEYSGQASAYKYEKKAHGKHEKYDKPEHKEYKPEHKEYKPDGYKPDGYKPDGYKPDGYKPDGYKPDGYKPDGYKPEYHVPGYEHYGEHAGYEYDGYGRDSYNSYDTTTPPLNSNQYDSGYYGGENGHHIIRLTTALQEALLNASTITGGVQNTTGPNNLCRPFDNGLPGQCDRDFGLLCGLKSGNSYDSYGDYSGASKGYPLLPKTPAPPVPIGEGYISGTIDIDLNNAATGSVPATGPNGIEASDIDRLLILDQHRVAYRVGYVNGFMRFNDGADDCYPLLGSGTVVQFGTDISTSTSQQSPNAVPVYAMLTKTKAPADPAWVWRLWDTLENAGNPSANAPPDLTRVAAEIQSADSEYKTTKTPEYKTASDGSKYVAGPGYTYLPQEDGTFCGLTLVIKGPATMSVRTSSTNAMFTGVVEAPVLFWDGVMRLPGISDKQGDNGDQVRLFSPGSSEAALFYGLTVQRLQAMCKSNTIPFADIGTWTLDMTRMS